MTEPYQYLTTLEELNAKYNELCIMYKNNKDTGYDNIDKGLLISDIKVLVSRINTILESM